MDVALKKRVLGERLDEPWLCSKVARMQDGSLRTLDKKPTQPVSRSSTEKHSTPYITAPGQWLASMSVIVIQLSLDIS